MNDNLDYSEYNEEKNRVPWGRVFLSLAIIILGVIIALLILKACGKPNLRNDLIESGKDYYEIHFNDLPTEIGECKQVSLKTLKDANLIKDNYESCADEKTYVNVCYLESKTYHYSAILECADEVTNYDIWKDGKEADLTENSDVRFKYLGELNKMGTKYYYPNNATIVTDVQEYYASVPSEDYNLKEDEQEGFKWYVEKEVKEYWNDGDYSSTQPSGYTKKGDSKEETNISLTRPSEASYRKISEITLYRYQKVAYPVLFYCKSKTAVGVMSGTTPCASREDGYTEFVKMDYSCGNGTVESGTVCADFTDWSQTKCENSVTNGIKCETKKGYSYTDTKWQWYKVGSGKSYYPSGSTSAEKENTYYVTSPVEGAIKDEATKATAYKYYKLEEGKENTNYEEWLSITDSYVTYEELISKFNELNYEVNSLKDINDLEEIRYQVQLQYRNLKD